MKNHPYDRVDEIFLIVFIFRVIIHILIIFREYPEVAGQLFEKEEDFRTYNISIDLTVACYNRLKSGTKKVEYDLIKNELKEIDIQLQRAETELNWNSDGIWSYIENLRTMVTDLDDRVKKTQRNIEVIYELMQSWIDQPMFTRTETGKVEKNSKKDNLLDIGGMSARKRKYYEEISKASKEITTLMTDSQKSFAANVKSKEWQAYLVYIDEIVINGLLKAVAASIGYLLDETDPTLTQGILLEVKFELNEPDVIFNPPLEKNIVGNVHDKVI